MTELSQQSVQLKHKNIYILPTKWGMSFLCLILLLLLIALVYNNNLTYLLAFLLTGVFFISIIHSYTSLIGLKLKSEQPQSVFAGEVSGMDIQLQNTENTNRYTLNLKLKDETSFDLAANEKKQISLFFDTQKRGWQTVPKVTLSSTYPMGLFRAWSPINFKRQALIYPRPSKEHLDFPEGSGDQVEQNYNPAQEKGNDDFFGLREYQPGDSIKRIHWKSLAKGLPLQSKEYSRSSQSELWLEYQQAPGQDHETRISQLCRWVINAEKAGLKYGLSVPGLTLQPEQGNLHYQQCLKALALL